MKLAAKQFVALQTALLDGYNRAGLRRMVRLGLDTPLDEITTAAADTDAVFDLIEWAERTGNVPALIEAAWEYNPQNAALEQLASDAAVWFAPQNVSPSPSATGAPAPPSQAAQAPAPHTGGDTIVANIRDSSGTIAVGKDIQQSDRKATT